MIDPILPPPERDMLAVQGALGGCEFTIHCVLLDKHAYAPEVYCDFLAALFAERDRLRRELCECMLRCRRN